MLFSRAAHDHLGTTRVVTNQTGANQAVCHQNATYPNGSFLTYAPFGGLLGCTQTVTHFKFTGKEKDTESGLDYFEARYNAGAQGRFLTPDPVGIARQKLLDPQQWNAYPYGRDNPLRLVDPSGLYVTNCNAKSIADCDEATQDFERARQLALHSSDAAVRAAAAAYGDCGDQNGVKVQFVSPAELKNFAGQVKQDHGPDGRPLKSVTVKIVRGQQSEELVAHEGSHVEDFQTFLKTGHNPTGAETDTKAYGVEAATLNDMGTLASPGFFEVLSEHRSYFLLQDFGDAYLGNVNSSTIQQIVNDRVLAPDPDLPSFRTPTD